MRPLRQDGPRTDSAKKKKCLFFDLDDTLYREPEFPAAVQENIARYMVEKLGYDPAGVRERMLQLYEKHGTTALGLCKEDGKSLDWNDWHKSVHWGSLDYELLKKQPLKALKDLLDSIPFQKIIFTNADKIHALKVRTRGTRRGARAGTDVVLTLCPSASRPWA